MRASLASSIAVTCAAVLALPVSLTEPAAASAPPAAASALPPAPELPGSTQSLPLEPLGAATRALGGTTASGEQGLTRRDVRPFSLVGVVWDDPTAPLHGTVQVRTRSTGDGAWSAWQDVETHNEEHGADPDTKEGSARALRGSTAPLWVGDSDGVEIRVRGRRRSRRACGSNWWPRARTRGRTRVGAGRPSPRPPPRTPAARRPRPPRPA
ncbi:hypothetical protein STANM309S_00861 [Streptomyces tanashiensis]